jgi:hypothetical protein
MPTAGAAATEALAWTADELPPGRCSRRFLTESQSSQSPGWGLPPVSEVGPQPFTSCRYLLVALVAAAATAAAATAAAVLVATAVAATVPILVSTERAVE